jgi:predicted HNH restriction endonuclease
MQYQTKQVEPSREQKLRARREAAVHRSENLSKGDTCVICGFDIYQVLRLHHVYPVANGWDSHPSNMVLLCPNCHAIVHRVALITRAPVNGAQRSTRDQDRVSRVFFELKSFLEEMYTENEVAEIMHYGRCAQ